MVMQYALPLSILFKYKTNEGLMFRNGFENWLKGLSTISNEKKNTYLTHWTKVIVLIDLATVCSVYGL